MPVLSKRQCFAAGACLAVALVVSATNRPEALEEDDECVTGEDAEHCGFSALQRRGAAVKNNAVTTNTDATVQAKGLAAAASVADQASTSSQCAPLSDPINKDCKGTIDWIDGGGKWDPQAKHWFKAMPEIAGVEFNHATKEDFQLMYYCAPPGKVFCGSPPCTCSSDKCSCSVPTMSAASRKVCQKNPDSQIACEPPKTPMSYKGMAWPELVYSGTQEMHIFAIGDWGGMDGSLNVPEGRHKIVAYGWGSQAGPSVFPRTRWDLSHEEQLCSHKEFIACFNSYGQGADCPAGCGFVNGVDTQPQKLVASALKERAEKMDPQFLLNVGDNFYWGGIEKNCGTPMGQISYTAKHQFDQIYENIYQGPGLSGKPWLSVLGNHDWGGRVFNNGWDQQIAYTWASERWVMPAVYYMVPVSFPDQDFTMDIYFVDSNFNDAKEPSEDPEHNLCGNKYNPHDADCTVMDGPASIESCPQYFADLWTEQKEWARKVMSKSKATWQLMVTHFPCGEDGENQAFYRELHVKYGLDLLVTGHRHDQEMWLPSMHWKNHMAGLTCLVTGGGGGITSEATPDPNNTKDWYGEAQYGFYDLTVSKTEIKIESVNYDGEILMTTTVEPKA